MNSVPLIQKGGKMEGNAVSDGELVDMAVRQAEGEAEAFNAICGIYAEVTAGQFTPSRRLKGAIWKLKDLCKNLDLLNPLSGSEE